jgi:hypothetical protein
MLAGYFLGWLIASGVDAGSAHFFIYLTNWSVILETVAFLVRLALREPSATRTHVAPIRC